MAERKVSTSGGGERPLEERRASARLAASSEYSARREEILKGALRAFRAHGYSATTLADIAVECGCHRATVYYYFRNKGEILREVAYPMWAQVTEALEHLIPAVDLTGRAKLEHFITHLMALYADNYPELYLFLQEGLPQMEPGKSGWTGDMRDLARRLDKALTTIVEQGIDSGEFRTSLPPEIVAYGILGTLNWSYRWYRPGLGSGQDIGAGFAAMILDGLCG